MTKALLLDVLRAAIGAPTVYWLAVHQPLSVDSRDALLLAACVLLILARWRMLSWAASHSGTKRAVEWSLRLLLGRELASIVVLVGFCWLAMSFEVALMMGLLAFCCMLLALCDLSLVTNDLPSPSIESKNEQPWRKSLSNRWNEPLATAWLVPSSFLMSDIVGPLISALVATLLFLLWDISQSAGVAGELAQRSDID